MIRNTHFNPYLLIPFIFSSCASDEMTGPVNFSGTVVHIDLEGGFYGIRNDTGENLNPLNMPPDFYVDGLRVIGSYRASEGFDIHQWGTRIELIAINPTIQPAAN